MVTALLNVRKPISQCRQIRLREDEKETDYQHKNLENERSITWQTLKLKNNDLKRKIELWGEKYTILRFKVTLKILKKRIKLHLSMQTELRHMKNSKKFSTDRSSTKMRSKTLSILFTIGTGSSGQNDWKLSTALLKQLLTIWYQTLSSTCFRLRQMKETTR